MPEPLVRLTPSAPWTTVSGMGAPQLTPRQRSARVARAKVKLRDARALLSSVADDLARGSGADEERRAVGVMLGPLQEMDLTPKIRP